MITIKIRTENAAFEGDAYGPEAARILRQIADDLEACRGNVRGTYSDINGNGAAVVAITEE